jgi:uncharacterized protein involved in exopolysaccharide biosynthesis
MENQYNLLGILSILLKWRKQIIYVCLATAIGSALISLLLPVYFQSTTVFLAASPDRISTEALFPQGNFKVYNYGTGEDIDRILTIAESGELIDFMVDSFNLYEHYDINPDLPKAAHRIEKRFGGLYDVEKDKRDAIVLSIEDEDKELAKSMTKAARERIDYMALRLIRASQKRRINTLKENIVENEVKVRILGDTLKSLRQQFGIYNVQAQTELLPAQFSSAEAKLTREEAKLEAMKITKGIRLDTIRFTETRVAGIRKEVELLQEKLDLFNEGTALVDIIHKQYLEANQSLGEQIEYLKKIETTYNAEGSAIIVVEEARLPVVKSWPKRSMIVIGATLLVFIFTVFGVLLFETYRDINWKELLNAK